MSNTNIGTISLTRSWEHQVAVVYTTQVVLRSVGLATADVSFYIKHESFSYENCYLTLKKNICSTFIKKIIRC